MATTPPEDRVGVLSKIFQNGSSAKVLDFFMDHKDLDYSLAEIAEKAGISIQTASKEIGSLEKMSVLTIHRTIGKTAMYRLNSNLKELELLQEFALRISQVPTFQQYSQDNKRQEIIESSISS